MSIAGYYPHGKEEQDEVRHAEVKLEVRGVEFTAWYKEYWIDQYDLDIDVQDHLYDDAYRIAHEHYDNNRNDIDWQV